MIRSRGFALVFSIFLVVGLETVIAGNMINMMRHGREIQRVADRTQVYWVADAGIDQIVNQLRAYVETHNAFPATASATQSVRSNVESWYSSSFRASHAQALGGITLTVSVTYDQQKSNPDIGPAYYLISSTAKKNATSVTSVLSQTVRLDRGRLFDFSVFCNEKCEIAPGPDFTLEGPIFSNKDVFLLGFKGRTLTLAQSAALDDALHPERYLLQSAGNIYFFYNRAVGRNYLLDNATYRSAAPLAYVNAPGELEIMPRLRLDTLSGAQHDYPPRLYYYESYRSTGFSNGSNASDNALASPIGVAVSEDNVTRIEDSPGHFTDLTPPHTKMGRIATYDPPDRQWRNGWYTFDSYYGTQPAGSMMNVSSAFSVNALGPADMEHPVTNPVWDGFGSPLVPNGGKLIEDQRPQKKIPIGDADNPSGPHLLIEPLLDRVFPGTYPPEPPEVVDAKLQSQADLDIYCEGGCNNDPGLRSPDYVDLVDPDPTIAVIRTETGGALPRFTDYRVKVKNTSGAYQGNRVLEIDLERLWVKKPLLFTKPEGVVIYVHTYPPASSMHHVRYRFAPTVVKLIHGWKLPEHGLTVVTNGRLWIQGNYNTYDYTKARECNTSEWESGDCSTPPAAVFSDSFGVLSNEWSEGNNFATDLNGRLVQTDVMVNTAVATGFVASRLVPRHSACTADISNCDLSPPFWDNKRKRWNLVGFECPSTVYKQGKDAVAAVSNCEFYRDISDGKYYLNKNSTAYLSRWQVPNPDLPSPTSDVRIPIFADAAPLEANVVDPNPIVEPIQGSEFQRIAPVKAFPGIDYGILRRDELFTVSPTQCTNPPRQCTGTLVEYPCTVVRAAYCDPPSGENLEPVCYDQILNCPEPDCVGGTGWYQPPASCPNPKPAPTPEVRYKAAASTTYNYRPLYLSIYSGGIENLINFQEAWKTRLNLTDFQPRTFRFSGTLSAAWFAKPSIPSWNPDYYNAPIRDYRYNHTLRVKPPPATPSTFSLQRTSWSEE